MKKLPVLCFVLAGFAVRCDDANYYIIRLPEESHRGRPFQVFWNVPTMQCTSKKIPFNDLDAFGIIQNAGDSFIGNKMTILYDPGLFPALIKNEKTGKFEFRNGGVPQEGNLSLHLDQFRADLIRRIPDENYAGVAVIDFESWRPVLRQNFGDLVPYKDISYEIERKIHRWWPEAWIKEEAKSRFEEAGRVFMQNTISLAKKLRPQAVWGYYGFPYCYNMATDRKEDCAAVTKAENDRSYWLWSESSALYPSVYSSKSLTTHQLTFLVRGRMREAGRHVRKHSRVLPYMWYRYRDGGFLSQKDLAAILETIFKSEAAGLIIWGSSNDVRTVTQCENLHNYVYNILGPTIANYTKLYFKEDSYVIDSENTEDDAVSQDEVVTDVDDEYNWIPPVNYTDDIKKYVDDEYKNEKPDVMSELAEEASLLELINKVYENNAKVQMATEESGSFKSQRDNESNVTDKVIVDQTTIVSDNVSTTTEESSFYKSLRENEANVSSTDKVIVNQTTIISDNDSTTTESRFDVTRSVKQESDLIESTIKMNNTENNTDNDDQIKNTYQTSTFDYHKQSTTAWYKNETEEKSTENDITLTTTDLNSITDSYTTITEEYTTESTTNYPDYFGVFTEEFGKDIVNYDGTTTDNNIVNETRTTSEPVYDETTITSTDVTTIVEPCEKEVSSTTPSFLHESSRKSYKNNIKTDDSNSTALKFATSSDQVSSSGHRSRFIICLFFYFYSVSKCICDLYNQC